ncbi:hypothetical protein JCM8547_006573 [Rhodosporidiobolus lusitaniae]
MERLERSCKTTRRVKGRSLPSLRFITCRFTIPSWSQKEGNDEPAIANYTPPHRCSTPGTWAAVALNLTVTSNGTQFDRLGSISLGHVEIWRTSTAEPTRNGVFWSYEKDVTRFSPLFAKPGQLLFELNNVVNANYTGIFSTVLTATFYSPTKDFPARPGADVIIPVSTGSKNGSQMLVYPGDASARIRVPINTAEAWLEVIATGAAEEEFWYTNVLSSFADNWPDAGLIGKGPFREVQVQIDGVLAGVVYPFPVIYTGGANPLLWRPLASLRAFDIPSFFVDVTPFLPSLTNGQPHKISFSVYGQGENGSVNNNWFITGALHLTLDSTLPPVRTTGSLITYEVTPEPLILSGGIRSANGQNLTASVKGTRSVNIVAEVKTGSENKTVHWAQAASLANWQFYTDNGTYENVDHATNLIITSTHSGRLAFRDTYAFNLELTTNYTSISSSRFSATLPNYTYNRALTLPPPLGGLGRGKARVTRSSQAGWASIDGKVANRSVGRGEMKEKYEFEGERGETYWEKTRAVNATIASREFGGSLAKKGE